MCNHRYNLVFSMAAQYLLLFLVGNLGPVLIGEVIKLLISVVMACVLAFVLAHGAKIRGAVLAWFYALLSFRFVLTTIVVSTQRCRTTVSLPHEPILAVAFQRPPPVFSF